MANITLQLDDALIEHLRKAASMGGSSVEALIAKMLRDQLPPDAGSPDSNGMHWNQEEAAFLHEMVSALDEVPASTPLGSPGATEREKPGPEDRRSAGIAPRRI